jgi:hypothetical protein
MQLLREVSNFLRLLQRIGSETLTVSVKVPYFSKRTTSLCSRAVLRLYLSCKRMMGAEGCRMRPDPPLASSVNSIHTP